MWSPSMVKYVVRLHRHRLVSSQMPHIPPKSKKIKPKTIVFGFIWSE